MSCLSEISDDRLDLLEQKYNKVYAKAFPLADKCGSLANMTEYLWRKKSGRCGDGGFHERRGVLTNIKLARNTWAIIGNEHDLLFCRWPSD
jgi:hypothetical protein